MLPLLAALLPAGSIDDVKAIAQLYYDACLVGRLQLPVADVVRLDQDPILPATRYTGYVSKIEKATYFSLKKPKNTYISMIEFQKERGQTLKSSCSVATSAINPEQALQVFKLSSPGIEPQRIVPFIVNRWDFYSPQQGYLKSFRFINEWSTFTTEISAPKGEKSE